MTAFTAALATTATVVLPAQAAAPTVELQPHELTRGADIAVPHIEDGDFVDGTRRIELPGTVARIIGPSGEAWLVGTSNVDRKRNRRVVRVEADNTVTTILTNLEESTAILSADGSTLAWQRWVNGGRKVITYVASSADGEVRGEKGPTNPTRLLDVSADRVLFAGNTRAFQWKFATGRSRTLVKKFVGFADIEHDLLEFFTKDPYNGGCAKLVRLSDVSTKVWRSCDDRVWQVSPDGTQLVTTDLLADGVGPGRLTLREIDGTALVTYTTGWFEGLEWESAETLLLRVNGLRKYATVRCTLTACENATDPVKAHLP
jgi:hypothetical protein